MVATGVADSNPQLQQQPSSSSSAPSVEDEALKRNTDCVYFLASPLTCKKGSECEYRHSEYARVNPRDCYYWLNGSCLNPKCAFRHPPLDALLGTQVAASAGSSMPAYPAPMPVAHATYNPVKQAVPCIFFQKGFCVKGDKCAFLHGPNPVGNKVLQAPPAVPSAELPAFKKPMVGLQKCNQELNPPQLNAVKPNKATPDVKIAATSDNALVKNAMGSEPSRMNDESWRSANVAPAANGKIIARANRTHQADVSDDLSLQNGLDADDYHRESSPGFDVLVDDETGQSEYYHDDEQYGRIAHDGRKGMNEFDVDYSTEYDRVAGGDHEMVRDSRGYYSHKQMAGQYAWEEHRGSAHSERRRSRNSGSPENETTDLRHHLAKQRRVNGLRSVINHEFARDNHNDGRRYHDSHRDSHHIAPRDSSLSNRLGDRLKAPRRSPPRIGTDMPSRRDLDSGRSFGRLSPGRPAYSSHQGRFRDRIRGRVQDDSLNRERGFRGPRIGRDGLDDGNPNFAGPKSLAELKGGKNSEVKEQLMKGKELFSLGKRKNGEMGGHQQSEGDVSFEGPKPLSEILKRKRGETSYVRSEVSTGNTSENNQNESKDNPENQEDLHGSEIKPAVNTEVGQSSQMPDSTNKIENGDGMNVEEGEEYAEGYEEGEGEEYYYEQDEEGEYNLEEGENAYGDEEYPEEEEGGAESADKMGVVYS